MRVFALLTILWVLVDRVSGFQPLGNQIFVRSTANDLTPMSVAKREDDPFESLTPETSFGSEVVPEAQRPINEYLDVMRAPLFDWASEEKGSKGLLTRLLILYGVVFGAVCYPISGASKFSPSIFCWPEDRCKAYHLPTFFFALLTYHICPLQPILRMATWCRSSLPAMLVHSCLFLCL